MQIGLRSDSLGILVASIENFENELSFESVVAVGTTCIPFFRWRAKRIFGYMRDGITHLWQVWKVLVTMYCGCGSGNESLLRRTHNISKDQNYSAFHSPTALFFQAIVLYSIGSPIHYTKRSSVKTQDEFNSPSHMSHHLPKRIQMRYSIH